MAQKVELDTLEGIKEDQPIVGTEPSPLPEPQPGDQQMAQKRPYKWWIWPCMIVIGLCLAAGGAFFAWQMTGHGESASTAKQPPVEASMPGNMANLDNFVIDYRQPGGDFCIVTFALTVEFNHPVNGDAIRDRVDLREAIYELSKKKSAASVAAPEQRGAFKKEIASEIEKRFGAGAVKAVYFTRFCVL